METEKVCVNLAAAELGQIDVLVAEGLFASRTDVIRNGIRLVIEQHGDAIGRVVKSSTRVGYQIVTVGELNDAKARGERLSMVVVGVLRIMGGVTPELADETIAEIRIFGSLRAAPEVVAILGDRILRGGMTAGGLL